MQRSLSLVADIGGTNTRIALTHGRDVQHDTVRRYANAGVSGLETHLRTYLDDLQPGQLTGACVALAGPVHNGVGQMTNLSWRIDRDQLGAVTGASKLAVLNDLQAQGHAVGQLAEVDLTRFLPQPAASPHAARLVVGLGTGFNAAPIYDTAGGQFVPPSECGHITLPRSTPAMSALADNLAAQHGFAAIEDALSGRGLVAIHHHLHRDTLAGPEIISRLEQGDADATATATLFVQILGTVIGDLALIHLPFGGIYLCGGMARAIAPWLEPLGFDQALRAKGRFGDFIGQFGIALITDDYAALTGCATHLDHLPQS